MEIKIAFTLLTLGLLSTSVEAQIVPGPFAPAPFINGGGVDPMPIVNGPDARVGHHINDTYRGTGDFAFGKGTLPHFDLKRHNIVQPTSRRMDYGSSRPSPVIVPTR